MTNEFENQAAAKIAYLESVGGYDIPLVLRKEAAYLKTKKSAHFHEKAAAYEAAAAAYEAAKKKV